MSFMLTSCSKHLTVYPANLQDQLDYAGNSEHQRSPSISRQELRTSTRNQLAIADVRQFDDQLNREPVGYTGPNGGEDARGC